MAEQLARPLDSSPPVRISANFKASVGGSARLEPPGPPAMAEAIGRYLLLEFSSTSFTGKGFHATERCIEELEARMHDQETSG